MSASMESARRINLEHIQNGRIVEHWRVTDELALQRQLRFIRT
jgi:predicted ester cyclase